MFKTNPDDAISMEGNCDGHHKNWRCISHKADMLWFYATEQLVAEHFLANPSFQMILTSSIEPLDRTLSGKNKGRSIKKIQTVWPRVNDSPFKPDCELGIVTRITRFNSGSGQARRYLVESSEGILLDGPLDGAWGRCKQKVLMDVRAAAPSATPSADESRYKQEVQRKVLIQMVDLFKGDVWAGRDWLERKNPELGDKAPKDLATEEDYLLLADLISRLDHNVFT